MASFERKIYDLVKDRPWLKDGLKKIYQGTFSMFGRAGERGYDKLTIRENCFFGFHDKSPWSADNQFLLAHQFEGTGNEPESAHQPLDIVKFSGENWEQPTTIGQTRAWNWQQGSQLQWRGQMTHIVFNDFVEGVCKAVEVNNQGEKIKVYDYPVAAISPDGETMAAYCFKTFGDAMPGYGYDFSGANARSNIQPDTLLVFTQDGEIQHEIAGSDLPVTDVISEDARALTFISHVLFSKTGKRLAFMRRMAIPGRRLRSSLYLLDCATGKVKRVPFKNMVSHYCWLNDDEIFAYANTEAGDGYYSFSLSEERLHSFSDVLNSLDGHPHSDASGQQIVFDTYPNKKRLQRLAVFNWQSREVSELAMLYSPMKFWGNKRVDLHPRYRADGQYVCVDCSRSGVRSLGTMPVGQ